MPLTKCQSAIATLVVLAWVACRVTVLAQTAPTPPSAPAALAAAKSWGYQLQKVEPETIAGAPYDVFVIDYSRDGTDVEAFTAEEIARLKTKPDGSPRIVLAYLSIGEAEIYRYYWQWYWYFRDLAPAWLGIQNKKWIGNYPVRFWHEEWQAIIFSGEHSYLDRIIGAGFDGVYLDRVDAFHDFDTENPVARDQMIAFVKALGARARLRKPGFFIVPQNAEELLAEPEYRAAIDGIAKEDLVFGDGKPKQPNSVKRVEAGVSRLKLLGGEGKPVFVVEYLDAPQDIARARKLIEEAGFIPHFADRQLNSMRIGDLPPERRRPPGKK